MSERSAPPLRPKTKQRPIVSPTVAVKKKRARRKQNASSLSAGWILIAFNRRQAMPQVTPNEAAPRTPNAAPADAKIVKRSIAIAGHRTSVSLEEIFWRELKSMAECRGSSTAALVAEIDAGRQGANLSSAIRVFVLEALLARQ